MGMRKTRSKSCINNADETQIMETRGDIEVNANLDY